MGTTIATTDFKFPGQTDLYHGKVRDIYTINADTLVSVATDRISAFDVILPKAIPFKGQVLNQLAAYFLDASKEVVANWLEAVPDPNVSVGIKVKPFKIEMVVRGTLVGHAWREYESGKRVLCGEKLPDGLKEYDKLPKAIITPSTKADSGHDEDISADDIIRHGLAYEKEWDQLSKFALELFSLGQKMADERGLILADTKYEFGKLFDKIILIDEIHTPDSSRYFYKDSYEAYVNGQTQEKPKHLSKEFVRTWLMENGFSGQSDQTMPEMSDEFVEQISLRYIELYEQMSGMEFIKAKDHDPLKRIESAITNYLQEGQA
jgi:phosphoribosylaminoimidazole-succinocarboxamide synthase